MPPPRETEPARILLAFAGDAEGEWAAALEGADPPARTVLAPSLPEAGAALRDPLDLVIVGEDAAGSRGDRTREVAALLADARCPVRLVSVASPWVPSLLATEIRRQLAAAEVEMRNGLAERIAHDLSNLLAPIPLALQLLRPPAPLPGDPGGPGGPGGVTALDAVDSSTRRAMSAARDLSALLTAPEGAPVRVGAKHLLTLAARLWSGSRVLSDYPPDLGCVRARAVALGQVLWCCARRELDRVAARSGEAAGPGPEAGDLVFAGCNLDGEVDLRVGWVGPAGDERPLSEREAAEVAPDAGLATLAGAVAAQGGTLEILTGGGRPAGFRVRLPAHER